MGMDMDIPIMDITGDEDKNLEFFSTSKHNKFKHNMDLMELVQKNSKIVLDAIGRIWINKIGKKDLFQTIFMYRCNSNVFFCSYYFLKKLVHIIC